MNLNLVEYLLWFTAPLLQLGVVFVMYRRGLHRRYPYFFNYTVLAVLAEPALYLAHRHSYNTYYYAYYVNVGLSLLISVAVFQDILNNIFRTNENLQRGIVFLFPWSVAILFTAVVVPILASHPFRDHMATDMLLLGERALRLAQGGLMILLLLFCERLEVSRRNIAYGIVCGFGLFAAMNLLVAANMRQHAIISQVSLRHLNALAYMVACSIWLAYVTFGSDEHQYFAWRIVPSEQNR